MMPDRDLQSLVCPLPEDIAALKGAGEFSLALEMIDRRLQEPLPQMLKTRLEAERRLLPRLAAYFDTTADDLLGTVVVVSHEDGFTTVYANLEENPAVNPGDWVEAGSVIGTVGSSALSEVSEESHLHFAVRLNGVDRDPLEYLPA